MTRSKELRREVEMLLARIKARRQLLTPETVERLPPMHAGYITALLDLGVVCVSPGLHAQYKKYIGAGYYVCEACLKLAKEIAA